MKVSLFVFELTATPAPRAVLIRNRFAPILLKTAYPADFLIASRDSGWSLYRSSSVAVAILRVFSRFSSGESPAFAKPPAIKITARLEAMILSLIGPSLVTADGLRSSHNYTSARRPFTSVKQRTGRFQTVTTDSFSSNLFNYSGQ